MALVGGTGDSGLSTTGQLDWFSLSKTTVSFSLEVVARIANAGVELHTVGVGMAVCSAFSFPFDGQKELFSSLNLLKGASSFSDVLYFGFGFKHIVRTLSESEQGATIVALCAALAVPYEHFRVAEILRELSKQTGAPTEITPSIHQWSKLVDVCAGSLAKSHFHHTFRHFTSLLAPKNRPIRRLASAEEVAKALLGLAKLSKNSVHDAVFVGGMDCALLAAIAKCLLYMRIELRDGDHRILYTNCTQAEPQATFLRETVEETGEAAPSSLVQRLYFVTSGREILKETEEHYFIPMSRDTVLEDAFPPWSTFSDPSIAKNLCLYLASSDELWSPSERAMPHRSLRPGSQLVRRAAEIFPEIARMVAKLETEHSFVPEGGKGIRLSSNDLLAALAASCKSYGLCRICRPELGVRWDQVRWSCLKRIARTVKRVIIILDTANVEEDVSLSVKALRLLYKWHGHSNLKSLQFPTAIIPLVLFLFTGVQQHTKDLEHQSVVSAASGKGVAFTMPSSTNRRLTLTEPRLWTSCLAVCSTGVITTRF